MMDQKRGVNERRISLDIFPMDREASAEGMTAGDARWAGQVERASTEAAAEEGRTREGEGDGTTRQSDTMYYTRAGDVGICN